ncbi:MAG: acyl-CoA dehydratase activase [Syntrophobacteraceae bacterium]
MAYYVGIDAGSVSINCIVIDQDEKIVYEHPYVRHFGLVLEEMQRLLDSLMHRFAPHEFHALAFTGMHGELLSEAFSAPFEVETIAQVVGAVHVFPGVRSIISMGGQDAALFQLDYDGPQWVLDSFNMNGPCASGTGSFIDQQAERLAQSLYGSDFYMDQEKLQRLLDDFIALGLESSEPAPVACRCTVFTKSDMIHLQNKGESLANIIAGLHHGNAANYVSTMVANRALSDPIIFVGGMASNALQVKAFRRYFPKMQVPPRHDSLGALGIALHARRQGWRSVVDVSPAAAREPVEDFPRAEPLEIRYTRFDPNNAVSAWTPPSIGLVKCFLGVDIGSTSTKYALIDGGGSIIHKHYAATQGRPIEVAQRLLGKLEQAMGNGLCVAAIATTGSGRNVVGDFLDADLIIDEITAHARGAVEVDPEVDTIFEIGGQDSKYIHIDKTHPIDFDMNKVCAAGTGSFLHELANKMKINIVEEFQEIALSSRNPLHLAERCTVFMESDLVGYAQKGASREDLIAGLCYAIVYNYLNRVVEKRYIGKRVMFLGGPSLNRGIVAAFEKVLDRPLITPKHREVMGAYGAALAVRDLLQKDAKPWRERNMAELTRMEVHFTERICQAEKKCHNECKLKVYNFGARKSIWGGECGRYEVRGNDGSRMTDFFLERRRLFSDAVAQAVELGVKPGVASNACGPVVGIPMALHSLDWGVFWAHVFSGLGCTVILSPPTTNQIALTGMECMTAETCFPVKVFHGHVKHLVDRVECLFLPNVISTSTPMSNENGLFCPFVASSQFMARAALDIAEGRLIRPTLRLKDNIDIIAEDFLESLPSKLRPTSNIMGSVVRAAWEKQSAFRETLRQRGRDFLSHASKTEPIWIITGRPYNLYDERLNLQLGRRLAQLGIQALPMDFIDPDAEDLSDFPRMYWGLGARILRTAKAVARTPNWFGVHLTNFGCGADSFIEHFYRHILQEKPSLILEFDEHSAIAGLLTRIEAFRNVVKNSRGVESKAS